MIFTNRPFSFLINCLFHPDTFLQMLNFQKEKHFKLFREC
uniref:Uncharacterized protein n=1 Tax=Anguilla anguilla TaxID=7936 RepID=A0A0E9T424_ANGAN